MINCNICSNGLTCDVCSPSYSYLNEACVSNGLSNCVSYASDYTVCLSCEAGYEVTARSCNSCTGCGLCA